MVLVRGQHQGADAVGRGDQAGIGTASVSWPVSVNAGSVDTLIPEYWRNNSPGEGNNPQDRFMMAAISRPDGALEEMEQRIVPT